VIYYTTAYVIKPANQLRVNFKQNHQKKFQISSVYNQQLIQSLAIMVCILDYRNGNREKRDLKTDIDRF